MKLQNVGRAFILTGIIELILSAIFYSNKQILSLILGNYSYFCLLIGTIIIGVSSTKNKNN
ncbi:TPA: hypothetical protein HA332_13320 [Sulfurisphaera tokodaii]|uniref:Uncharacterized protein n=1 Tax=Sulfurisphaera tokodaii TaxID=111955 RepID=A0A832TK55_9CREN|nr:hypothetical protein [Sulfurisphaera tokodaii]